MNPKMLKALSVILLVILAAACSKAGVSPEAKALLKEKKYDEGIALLEQAYAANANSQAIKQELLTACVEYGNELTFKSDLPPNQKYAKALRFYRRALQLEPQQKEALEGKNLIESIYASMGRPVPQ